MLFKLYILKYKNKRKVYAELIRNAMTNNSEIQSRIYREKFIEVQLQIVLRYDAKKTSNIQINNQR